MSDFDALWRSAVRFRRASRELQPLLRDAHAAMLAQELTQLRASLEQLLIFLAAGGRTDANCTTTFNFFNETEALWNELPGEYRAICDDMSGTLHDAIYAPDIARTFEALPEQLLARVRLLGS